MRELTLYELNEVSGGITFSLGSATTSQLIALNGLSSGGAYLWGNIARKQESTIAGFTGSMVGGMGAGVVGAGIAKVSTTATGVGAATLGTNYTQSAVSAGFERLAALGAERLSESMQELGL